MAWLYFRKTSKFGPLRITSSRSGLSFSAGNKHYRSTVSTSGRRTTTVRIGGWTKRTSRGR